MKINTVCFSHSHSSAPPGFCPGVSGDDTGSKGSHWNLLAEEGDTEAGDFDALFEADFSF